MPSWWKLLIAIEASVLLLFITGETSVIQIVCLYMRLINITASHILDAPESETKKNVFMQSSE